MKNLRLGATTFPRLACAAPVLIVLLGFALRVYRLGAQPIWWDESLSVYRSTRDLGTVLSNQILIQNVVTYDTLPPLYFVFLKGLVILAGTKEYALRFLSLAANVATIPLLYVLARRWSRFVPGVTGTRVALLAALLGALSPFYVWYAQEARPYTLVLFWSTLAIYALTRAFVEPARTISGGWMLTYILSAAAALYTHYYSIFLIPFHVLMIAALTRRHQRAWIVLPVLPVVAASPLVPLIRASMEGNASTGPYFVPLDVMLRDVFNSFSVGITVDLAQVLWIDAMLVILFLLGTVGTGLISPNTFKTGFLLLAYVLVPVLGVFAASYIRPLYQNSRYLISISPAFYIGVAMGTAVLAQRGKVLAVPALAVFLIGAALSLGNLYFNPRFGKDDHRAWSDYLHEHVQPGDFLILNSPHTEELFRYYVRDALPWESLPVLKADRTASPEADLTVVREALASHARVWYLSMDVPFDDPDKRIEALLNQEGVLLDRVDVPATSTELSLSLYLPALPSIDAARIGSPLNIAFSGNLRLRGYDAPPAVQPGKRSAVRLYWQIDAPVGEDYAVSLRMVAPDGGAIISQWDSIPLGNRAGSSTWHPNTILVDSHDLPVDASTPQGKYDLQVVPYHAATGSALGEPVTLGEIQVQSQLNRARPSGAILTQGAPVP